MSVGLSKAKLSGAMLEILTQLPAGTENLRETIVAHLGLMGQLTGHTSNLVSTDTMAKKKCGILRESCFPGCTMVKADRQFAQGLEGHTQKTAPRDSTPPQSAMTGADWLQCQECNIQGAR